jgi:hypothetical protein
VADVPAHESTHITGGSDALNGLTAAQIASVNPSALTGTGTVPAAGLPVATASALGAVKQGSGVAIAGDGTLSSTGGAVAATPFIRGTLAQPTFNARIDGSMVGDGTTDNVGPLVSSVAAAITAGVKRFYVPGGTYFLNQTVAANILALYANDIEIFGDGMQETVFVLPSGVNFVAGKLRVFDLLGSRQTIRDLSIIVPPDWRGGGEIHLISRDQGSFRSHIQRVECSGMYGANTSGGSGIDTSQLYNAPEYTTTLGTAVAAPGAATVTPASMFGIYPGRVLIIGGTVESVVVTAHTASTFTATFANTHAATDSVTTTSNANQYALIEDCFIHDAYASSGIVIDSSNNIIRNNIIIHIGSSGTPGTVQHGIYEQGGWNVVEGNHIEGVTGYSIHGHKAVPNIDSTGARYIHNTSINPGVGHVVIDSVGSDGTNPEIPNGTNLMRGALVAHNYFRGLKNSTNIDGVVIGSASSSFPVTVAHNTFEDAGTTNVFGNTAGITDVIVEGNTFRQINRSGGTAISGNSGSKWMVRGNKMLSWTGNGVTGLTDSDVEENDFQMTAGSAVTLGTQLRVARNRFELSGTAKLTATNGMTDAVLDDNRFITASNYQIIQLSNQHGLTARRNKMIGGGLIRYDSGSKSLVFAENEGQISFGSLAGMAATQGMGRLLYYPKGATTFASTGGQLLKLAAGVLAITAAGDASFLAVSLSSTTAAASDYYAQGGIGTEALILTDGAWVQGNIGVVSATAAGKIHDSASATPPASGSYVLFLDAGAAAGTARCLILKTL